MRVNRVVDNCRTWKQSSFMCYHVYVQMCIFLKFFSAPDKANSYQVLQDVWVSNHCGSSYCTVLYMSGKLCNTAAFISFVLFYLSILGQPHQLLFLL